MNLKIKKAKKLLSILLAVLMFITTLTIVPVAVSAAEAEVDSVGAQIGQIQAPDFAWSIDNGTLTISGHGPMMEERDLPLGPYTLWIAPWKNSEFTKVVIEDGITNIAYFAFSECKNLTSVTIPNSVVSIDICAFYGCSSLTSVTIPESVTSIDSLAFKGCDNLTIIGFEGSAAQTYAIENGFDFLVGGDADINGSLAINDATCIQRYLAEFMDFDESQLKAADFNGDGYVNIRDVTAIQRWLVGFKELY